MSDIQFLIGKSLEERIRYYMQSQDEKETFYSVFSDTEWNVLCALRQYEYISSQLQIVMDSAPENLTTGEKMVLQLERIDCEKDSILALKRNMTIQLDLLLQQGGVDAWCEILVWYQYVIQKNLANQFWDFYVLKMMLDIFVIECKASSQTGEMPSVMQIHEMQEMMSVYFKLVFLLRRIEFDVEPIEELKEYKKQQGFSDRFIDYILQNAQIHNKEKVQKVMEEWGRK